MENKDLERLARLHGWFFVVSGGWPVLHRRSFERVTGPKADFWLVRTVGALIAVSGIAVLRSASRRRVTPEIAVVAAGGSAALAAVDLIYVPKGRISPIYLLDAAGELAFVAAWLRVFRGQRMRRRE